MLTNSICWARFERMSLGQYKLAALSWMFRQSKIPWAILLQMGVRLIFKRYGISGGVLVSDDSDHERSKKTPKLYKTDTIKDQGRGGYIFCPFFETFGNVGGNRTGSLPQLRG